MYHTQSHSGGLVLAWLFIWAGISNLSASPSSIPLTGRYDSDYYDYYNYGDYEDACYNWQTYVQESHVQIVTPGESGLLRCPYSDCWEGYTTTWYHNGVQLELRQTDVITQNGDAGEQLQFMQLRQEDAGKYTCRMSNGTHTFVGNIQLETRKPVFTTAPSMPPVDPPEIQRSVGQNATFLCKASFGITGPATFPQLYWIKNNTFIINSDRVVLRSTNRIDPDGFLYMNVSLSIYHIQEGDFGQFTCIAHTTYGWTSQNATLVNDASTIEAAQFGRAKKTTMAKNSPLWALSIVALIVIAAIVTVAVGIKIHRRRSDDCKALNDEGVINEKPQDAVSKKDVFLSTV